MLEALVPGGRRDQTRLSETTDPTVLADLGKGKLRRCLGGREDAHIDAGLGDQDLGGTLLDARDRHQQITLARETADPLLDLGRELADRFVQKVDVRNDLRHDQRVLGVEATLERFPTYRDSKRPRLRGTTRTSTITPDNLTITLPERCARAPRLTVTRLLHVLGSAAQCDDPV